MRIRACKAANLSKSQMMIERIDVQNRATCKASMCKALFLTKLDNKFSKISTLLGR